MNDKIIQKQISWSLFSLAAQRINVTRLLLRLKDMALRAGGSIALHGKFMRLMDQVAEEQKKELNLIIDIEEMEKRHAQMRARKLLRHPGESPAPQPPVPQSPKAGEKPSESGFLRLFWLYALFSQRGIKHKNQDLTVD